MSEAAPPSRSRVPSREQLLYLLHEAAEIEHNLMCCYFYAAFSLKRADPRWSPEQAALVAGWRSSIHSVAFEEMTHLCLVGNLMSAIGGAANFARPPFPIEAGPYPADFVIRLQPFSTETVGHFVFLERPHGSDLPDAPGFEAERHYRRGGGEGRLSPGARDYDTVGELYITLRKGFDAFAAEHGAAALFVGDQGRQVDADLAPLPGVSTVVDLASAHRAFDTIVTQGEGAGDEHHESHFNRFTRMAAELEAAHAADAAFAPAWPAATNPVMNPPPTPGGKVHVQHPVQAGWLDIGNAIYSTSLRCLVQGFGCTDRAVKATWLAVSFALMRAMVPVGQGLAARPARDDAAEPNAGLTFTSLRTLAWLPEASAAGVVSDRLGEILGRAEALPLVPVGGETAQTWLDVVASLQRQRERLGELAGRAVSPVTAAPVAPVPAPAAPAAAHAAIEVATGEKLRIHFDAARCIHSRHCVLQAPAVFAANTPGQWIHPDRMDVERLVDVAEQCPSGAIRYERLDGAPAEAPPPVNLLRIRENGPYAVHADLAIAGQADGFRATLCRCGQSANKPWCDGSHARAGFVASGEPASGKVDPLAARDGAFLVRPVANGPLRVEGNIEICSGSGRTVARLTEARLCRCGQSRNKPFCDLSHVAAGFVAAGE